MHCGVIERHAEVQAELGDGDLQSQVVTGQEDRVEPQRLTGVPDPVQVSPGDRQRPARRSELIRHPGPSDDGARCTPAGRGKSLA
mgnify:CR=1 FL=1